MVVDKTTHRALSPGRTPLQSGIDECPICKRCLEKDESATHFLCDWGYSLLKILLPGLLPYGPRLLSRRPCKWDTHFVWSVGLLKGWNRGGCTIDHWRLRCNGQFRPSPYTFIYSFSHPLINYLIHSLSSRNSFVLNWGNLRRWTSDVCNMLGK
jgi:hypothetical protein